MTRLSDLTDHLLDAAQKAGADAADAIATDGISQSIDVLGGKLEHAERSEGIEIGLRVLIGQRQACVSASDIKPETIAEMADRAVSMARLAPEDPYIGLANPSEIARETDADTLALAENAEEPTPATLEDHALRAEAAALSVAGISKADSASAGYSSIEMHTAASNGFRGGYARTAHWVSCVAITGSGTEMERDYHGEMRVHRTDMPSPEEIGQLAGERTIARAGATKPPTGTYPVLYDERIAAGLIGHLVNAANGSGIARGASWLMDKLGERVLPEGLDLVEDPHRAGISASKPFDAEGLATRKRKIIDNGVLTGWTLDLATGRKLGMTSTANAARGTGSPPSPHAGNLTLTPGKATRDDLLRDMGTGLLVTSLFGASINPTTGDYSRGASGFWVENGEVTYPVNECTIAGNLHDMLASIRPANDGRPHLSRVVPSILVEGLTIAGA